MSDRASFRFPEAQYIDPGLPEYADNPLIAALPSMMSKKDVIALLNQRPPIQDAEKNLPGHIRVHAIARMTKSFFYPMSIHLNLERKISVLLRQGYLGRNPKNASFKKQLNNSYQRIVENDLDAYVHDDVDSTASSMSVIGISGSGKTTTFNRILKTYPKVIYHPDYNLLQVPWLKVDCPHDGTITEFCLSIFRALDRRLNTDYFGQYKGSRRGIGYLITEVANLCLLHAVGLLVIDEFQHLNLAKGGGEKKMINFLVKLINTIGVSVVIIGTPKALPLFAGEFRKARRAAGEGSILWDRIANDACWDDFINQMWQFQWLNDAGPLDEALRETLYDLSQGIADVVIKLFCVAQARAILLPSSAAPETITPSLLKTVYEEEFSSIHPMLSALRKGDKRKIIECSDISIPSIDGVMLQMFDHLEPPQPEQPTTLDMDDQADSNTASTAIQLLENMGVSSDIAVPLVTHAIKEKPDISVIQLIHTATAAHAEQEESALKKPASSKASLTQRKNWGQLESDDLRKVFNGKVATMYEEISDHKLTYPLNELLAS